MPSNPGHASTPTQAFPSWWSTMLLPSPKDIAGPALPLIYPHSTSQASDPAVSVGKAALSEKTGRSDFTTWTQDFLTQPRKQILKLSTGKKKKDSYIRRTAETATLLPRLQEGQLQEQGWTQGGGSLRVTHPHYLLVF